MAIERTNDPNVQSKCIVAGCSTLTTARVKVEDQEHPGCHHHSDEELQASLKKASKSKPKPSVAEEPAGGA